MPEIRVDPLSGTRTVIAPERAQPAPVTPAPPLDAEADPFAPGHEDRTPPELARTGGEGAGWSVRVVSNLRPALAADAPESERDAAPDLFRAAPARGAHEVIVNGPQAVSSLGELPVGQVGAALEMWRERLRAHPEAACLHLLVNERAEAGSSEPHTHAQLYALDFVPAAVAREREAFSAHAARTDGHDLLEDLVGEEVRRRARIVAIDAEGVCFAPWASRVPYQLLVAPRAPRPRFEDPGPTAARLLHDVLGRLTRRFGASPPLNLWVRTAPRGAEQFCWRIDVLPRLTGLAGLELGTGLHLNAVAPERAAAELREA